MVQPVLIGIVAGLASALLFMAPIGASMIAFPLFILTPLPIVIAGLGWGLSASLAATVAGALLITGILPGISAATIFAAVFAAPSVWLSRLATMSRSVDANNASAGVEWYPAGRLLLHAAIAVSAGIIVAGFVAGYDPATLADEATQAFLEFLADVETTEPAPTAESIQSFIALYVAVLPFTFSAFIVAVTVFNLWLGSIIARSSGRLARPRGRLWMLDPPNDIVIAFAVTLVLAVLLPGAAGDIAAVVAGAFGCALALIGLAVLHAVTYGMSGRGLLLTAAYLFTLISGLPLILFAILGGAENFLQLRARRFAGAPPT